MGRHWQGPVAVVAAVGIVAALSLLTVTLMTGLGSEDDDVAVLDAGPNTTSATVRSTTTRPAITIAPRPATTDAPEVLGDVTQRDAGSPTTIAPPAPGATAAPATTTPPSTTTTTTTAPCRNSQDPSCGPLVWDPQPGPYEVEVYAASVPSTAVVGEPVLLAVEVIEAGGADAIGGCAAWTVDDPGIVNISGCEAVPHSCDRHGPHDPPAPSREAVLVEREVTFTTAGEITVSVGGHTATHLADGCANPYLNDFARTYTVVVQERSS